MKLTPEQQNALCGGVGKDWNEILVRDVNAFLAGCRYQHQITLERAAKACEEWRRKHVLEECCDHAQHVALNSATAAIRALPFEDTP